jgi:hypothetical protein
MSKERNICSVKGCINEGRYCRIHIGYSVPVKADISKKSDKQKELDKKYNKVRKAFIALNNVCQANLEGCTKVAADVHHKAGRATEELYLNPKLFLPVCRNCHTIIEKNPAFSKQQGFSVSRHSKNKAA